MSLFVTELRKAHTVYTAYQRGARSIAELCSATHLPMMVVSEWTIALKLPLSYHGRRPSLPFAASNTFDTLNNQQA